MKKILLLVFCAYAVCLRRQMHNAMRIVDTKYILDKMPDYKDAQKKLDQISEQWQKEIDDKQAVLG